MRTVWFDGLNEDDAEELRQLIIRSKPVLDRLTTILYNKYAQKESSRLNSTNYELPNWGLLQADYIGYLRGIKEIIKILEIKAQSD